ncbi:MAG: restriction endonuclease subunit S [Tateyamaria sp.]|uniref:restriction endonuclease subunit S n=1 Tax=Alphaproteobacteria TaxID=28211 RepID=UPI00329403A0
MLDQKSRYDSYKDSGEIWLGDIPSDWSLECIRAVTELKSKRGEPDLPVLSVYRDYGVILKDSRDDNHNATSLDTSNYKVVEPGDLVVNKMKAWQGSMGVSAFDGIVSPAYITCRTDPSKIAPRFLHYTLRSQPFIAVYNSLSYGVRIGQWDMHYDDFKNIPLAYPDIDTQNRIVSFLDEKTAEIDAAIEKKRRLIDLLNEQKAILINRAVTKGLNPDAPMKDSGVDWIGEIPAYWKIVPLMAVSEVIDPNPSHRNPEYVDEGFPFISTQEFKGWDEIEIDTPRRVSEKIVIEQEGRCRFRSGSIVFSRKGTIGATRVLPFGVRLGILDSLCVINPKNGVTPEFLVGTLGADYLSAQYGPTVKGAALPQLSVGRVRALKIILPPDDEQITIQVELATLKAEHHRLDEIVKREISTLNEFKQTLIANAVTGKIKI